jgi:hypothetical protein
MKSRRAPTCPCNRRLPGVVGDARGLRVFLLVLAGALLSCSSSRSTQDLRSCAVGTWLKADRSCSCFSGKSVLNTPECGATDCRETDALILGADGTSVDVVLRRSVAQNRISIVGGRGGAVSGTWNANGAELMQSFSNRTYKTPAACDGTTLTRTEKTRYTHASAEVVAALKAASASAWTTQHLRSE